MLQDCIAQSLQESRARAQIAYASSREMPVVAKGQPSKRQAEASAYKRVLLAQHVCRMLQQLVSSKFMLKLWIQVVCSSLCATRAATPPSYALVLSCLCTLQLGRLCRFLCRVVTFDLKAPRCCRANAAKPHVMWLPRLEHRKAEFADCRDGSRESRRRVAVQPAGVVEGVAFLSGSCIVLVVLVHGHARHRL